MENWKLKLPIHMNKTWDNAIRIMQSGIKLECVQKFVDYVLLVRQ